MTWVGTLWDTLLAAVDRGDMTMEEASLRDNYYDFVSQCPAIKHPRQYVLDTPTECLPPAGSRDSEALFEYYVDLVRDRKMGPYEAAEAYAKATKGD